MMYSNVVNWFIVAVSLLSVNAVAHGEKEEKRMNGGDIVQSRKALLLRSRERLLSNARQQHYQRQQQHMADNPERDLQMMVCGVCTGGTSPLNKTLLEDVNEYIRTGEANTTEILKSMLKTIDASYSKNKKDMEKQYGLYNNDSSPDYISTSIMTMFAASQQKLKKTLVKFSNDVQSNQDGGGIFDLIDTITGIIEVILPAIITIFCLLIPDSPILALLVILNDLLFYVTTIIDAIAGILDLFGLSLLNSLSERRMLTSGEDDNDDDTLLFPVDALFPGIPCEIDTLLCQINTMKNNILSSGNNKNKNKNDP